MSNENEIIVLKSIPKKIDGIKRYVSFHQDREFQTQCKLPRVLDFDFEGKFIRFERKNQIGYLLIKPNYAITQFRIKKGKKSTLEPYQSQKTVWVMQSKIPIRLIPEVTYRIRGFWFEYDFETIYSKIIQAEVSLS